MSNPSAKEVSSFWNANTRRALYATAIIFSLGYLIWLLSDIFIYLVTSIILAAILRTPTNSLSQLQFYGVKMPRILAIVTSYLILFALITLFVYLFVPLISAQFEVIRTIDFQQYLERLNAPLKYIEETLTNLGIEQEEDFLQNGMRETLGKLLNQSQIGSILENVVSITSSFFVGLMAVLFITFFILYEKGGFKKQFISMIPNRYFEVSIVALSKTEKLLSNYLLGLLIQMTVIFTIVSTGLMIVGVEYAVTIGLFAAIANLIPYIGPLIGAIFGLIVGVSTNAVAAESQEYWLLIVKIVSVFGVVQVTDNILLQPLIFSRSVKAHPLAIFLIVFVGGILVGPVGMVAAIPSFTIIKVSFSEFFRGYRQYQVFR